MEYKLQRNGFHTKLNKYLKEDKKFLDVTLACEDDYQTKAHKIILSSGSPFFENILSKSKHQETFIFLNGIKKKDLQNMLYFLYNGETCIAEEEVQEFLKVCKMLDLDTKQIEWNHAREIDVMMNSTLDDLDLEPFPRYDNNEDHHMGEFKDVKGKTAIKIEDMASEKLLTSAVSGENIETTEKEEALNDDNFYNGDEFEERGQILNGMNTSKEEKEEIESDTDELCVKVDGLWDCKICGKTYVKRYHANRHARTHNAGNHVCNICDKILRTEDSLEKHVRYVHCTDIFSCNVCGKGGMSRMQLKNHKYLSKQCRKG